MKARRDTVTQPRASTKKLTALPGTTDDGVKFRGHSARLERNARAYNEQFYSGSFRGFCAAAGKCFRNYLIYPVVLTSTFVLACTFLLPLSIYYSITEKSEQAILLEHKDINDFLGVDSRNSNILHIEQLRILASRMRKKERTTARKVCDIFFALLCPCTGVFIIYSKVRDCLYQVEPAHKLKTYYSYPLEHAELKFISDIKNR